MRFLSVHSATDELWAVTPKDFVHVDIDARPDFAAFYDGSHRRLTAALSSTLGDGDLGREAADEGMARAYAHWGSVSHYDNPGGWVYRVGLNWAISVRRKLARRHTLAPPGHHHDALPADPQIAEALAKLDLRLRTVVVCRILLDWSTEDTAAALQIKPGTVKSRLHRGLGRLQDQLAHFEQGQP